MKGVKHCQGCSTSANIQYQVGQGSEQPDLVEYIPTYCRGVGLDDP